MRWFDWRTAALLLVVFGVGASVSHWNSGAPPVPAALVPENSVTVAQRIEALQTQVAELQRELRQEQSGRLEFQRQLQAFGEQLKSVQRTPQRLVGSRTDSTDSAVSNDAEAGDGTLETNAGEVPPTIIDDGTGAQRRRSPTGSPDIEVLTEIGVPPEQAESLRSRFDAYLLAELEVRDRAAREGWLRAEDFVERRDALLPPEVDLRAELGDTVWDRYLYQSGRPNRVRIDGVIQGSEASVAGLQPGDIVLQYGDTRVYTGRELQQATRAGQRGDIVMVRILRGDVEFEASLEQGPLGVTLGQYRRAPDT